MPSQTELKKIHVLYLPKWYPNRYDPMPGLFIKRHAESVSGQCDISVLYVYPDDEIKHTEVRNTKEDGINTWRIYYKKFTFRLSIFAHLINLSSFFYYQIKGIQLIRKTHRSPDIIHVNVMTRLGIVAFFYGMVFNIPYLITEHWTRYLPKVNAYQGKLRRIISEMVVKHAKAVLPVTENLKNAMVSHGLHHDNYQIVPNVVDTDLFYPCYKNKNNPVKKIVHLSCFTEQQKNISGILRVVSKLKEIRQDFEMHFIGKGEDFMKMKNLSDKLQLTGKFVFFDGLMEREQLAAELRNADLMILFSHYENLPVVILESFASGIPVISSNVGGIHEHMPAKLGVLIKPNDENEFLHSLNHELDHLSHYDKDEIRQYAIDHFSKEVIGKQLFNIYASIIQEH